MEAGPVVSGEGQAAAGAPSVLTGGVPPLGPLLGVWAVFFAGQMVEGYVVVPKLVGDRIGLHPVVVIFALLAFGQLFGFFGVLLALPASAALLVWLRYLRGRYLASPLYQG